MGSRLVRCTIVVLALSAGSDPRPAAAQCTDYDVTAVALVHHILDPDLPLALGHVRITAVQNPTFPPDSVILAAIHDVYGGSDFCHQFETKESHWALWIAQPVDFGAGTIVDTRNADVGFAGEITWAGTGSIVRPVSSTHEVAPLPGFPAGPPAEVATLLTPFWYGSDLPPQEELTGVAVDYLRATTLLRDFDGCGPYEAVGFAYTPAVGELIEEEIVEVVVIGGRLPVGYFDPTALEAGSWGRIKAIYRDR